MPIRFSGHLLEVSVTTRIFSCKERKEMPVAELKTQTATRETFNRPPRIWPSFPQGKVTIPAPPEREALPPKQSNVTLVMPLIMMGMMVGVYYLAGQRSPQQMMFLLPMLLFSLMSPLMNMITTSQKVKQVKRQWKRADRKYRELLKTLRAQLKEKADEPCQVPLLVGFFFQLRAQRLQQFAILPVCPLPLLLHLLRLLGSIYRVH